MTSLHALPAFPPLENVPKTEYDGVLIALKLEAEALMYESEEKNPYAAPETPIEVLKVKKKKRVKYKYLWQDPIFRSKTAWLLVIVNVGLHYTSIPKGPRTFVLFISMLIFGVTYRQLNDREMVEVE